MQVVVTRHPALVECLNPLLSEAVFSIPGEVRQVPPLVFCLNPLLSEAVFSMMARLFGLVDFVLVLILF